MPHVMDSSGLPRDFYSPLRGTSIPLFRRGGNKKPAPANARPPLATNPSPAIIPPQDEPQLHRHQLREVDHRRIPQEHTDGSARSGEDPERSGSPRGGR